VGYHRYFSHRSFQTSRFFQFLLAFGGCTAAQKGPLWWGAHHRRHHKYTDTPLDPHSPLVWGFWYAHVGWILDTKWEHADLETMKDFSRFPEIRFLHRWHLLPPVLLALGCLFFFGWQGLVIGFFLSTVLLYHGTFSVNSLSHLWGTQPYDTGDGSRNNFFIALWTGGEGWHNNHHHCMSSAKQGFRWWQIDWGYYILKVLSWLKIVRKLRPAPA
jgi:stearoyl-CoA desaturase (delta-9 desaturase)